jgi:glutathione synthase/RimK-type ligase-like ATP-grasp enzyme
MKKILILCRKDDRADYDTASSMAAGLQAVADNEITYSPCDYEDLTYAYNGKELEILDHNDTDIRSYDAIFQLGWFKTKTLEDMALSVALYAEHHSVMHRNSEALYNRSTRKTSQYVAAALNGVQTIPFIYAQDFNKMLVWARARRFPLIVKDAAASRGNNNHLAKNINEVEDILKKSQGIPYLIQDYIENDGDYRLLVAGNQIKLAMLRKGSEGSHLNNTSKGGMGTLTDIDKLNPSMARDAITIARVLRRDFSGIDMVVDRRTNKHYFLEANNMPQLSTGSNVSAKLTILHEYLTDITTKVPE